MTATITIGAFQLPYDLKEDFHDYKAYIQKLPLEDLNLLVCPPGTIRYFQGYEDYLLYHQDLAVNNSCIVAPGFFMKGQYNTAILISTQGEIIHEQQQTHLSRKEFDQGLQRGTSLEVTATPIGRIGLMIGTDSFYPIIGRILGLQKVDIVIAYYKQPAPYNPWLQLSGVWQQVQHNQFFAVESAANGIIDGIEFAGETMIHHPLCSAYVDGCVQKLKPGVDGLIKGNLDLKSREQIIREFPIYKYLNHALYEKVWGSNENIKGF
ncbi:carbon-nitrogen hydrolase family protein [Desulfitibacter alkalitolerans]|uniref:carbon-nitrogen hydrolase family protein n=1 Tax=Desulfitibacter alkalitolerans TaxID=264641 RepID=UPI0004803353|nr:carbon-nitrogen hydrolase family protein [Desulfitibacter alkalitolerans]